jgi:hypothetical protein
MSLLDRLEAFLLLIPIIALFAVGLVLTMRSGEGNVTSGKGIRRLVENLYQTLLVVGACLIGLAVIQQVVGLHVRLFW